MDQAEQLRNIIKKQNIRQHMSRVITVTSGKGGVGKSNVSVNLAIQLSRLNKKVVILDADFGLANIEVMLGIRPKYNLADMMFHGKSLREVICRGPENIAFISGGSGIRELTNVDRDQVRSLVSIMYELDNIADVVIIDTGAGISDAVIDLVLASQEVLLVATPEPTSITDAYALLKTLHRQPDFDGSGINIRMIANRTHESAQGAELYEKLNTVVEKFLHMKLDYLGDIPYDEKLPKAIMKQQPVSLEYPNSSSARAMLNLALALNQGVDNDLAANRNGLSGLFSKLIHSKR